MAKTRVPRKSIKPEVSIIAHRHSPKPITKQSKKKQHSKKKKKITIRPMMVVLFLAMVAAVLFVISTLLYVRYQISVVQPQNLSNTLAVVDGQEGFDAIYGSSAERLAEIQFVEGASDSLKDFVLADFTELKKNCYVNGAYLYIPRYRVEKVVRGKFALVVRDCGGEQRAVLMQTMDNWTEISTGSMACDMINQLAVPAGIQPTCLLDGIQYTNPN